MITTYLRIAGIATVIAIITFLGFKFNELKNSKIEIIELKQKQTKLETQIDLQLKIIDDINNDFTIYQLEEDLAIEKENNITKELETKEYTYKNIFKIIGEN